MPANRILKHQDFRRLNAIHVAGTKGKGSTSAFISSILTQFAKTDSNQDNGLKKVGLYTSPHLRSVRERIQINNEPLSERAFAQYFFETWERLEKGSSSTSPDFAGLPIHPVYFRFLTLMMFHAFFTEGIDTAVVECGIGGEYDSTNILEEPTVAAVTSLAIDHVNVLGETIEEIAWHKAGIFKAPKGSRGADAFTVWSQPPKAMAVLEKRAEEKSVTLNKVSLHSDIESGLVKLGLAGEFQKMNASLAVEAAAAHLRTLGYDRDVPKLASKATLPEAFQRGLSMVKWEGRCEVKKESNIKWHLDGGHTLESIELAAEWFASCLPPPTESKQTRVLFFNQQKRDAPALATALFNTLRKAVPPLVATDAKQSPLFTHAVFSTNITFAPTSTNDGSSGTYKPDLASMNYSDKTISQMTVQKALAETWQSIDPACTTSVQGTIEEAVRAIRANSKEPDAGDIYVLVTGSLHLVGGVLEVLESRPT